MDIFTVIKFIFKKPKIVIISGRDRKSARDVIFHVLKGNFRMVDEHSFIFTPRSTRMGDDVLLFETDLKDAKEAEKLKVLAEKSSLQVLAVTNLGQIPPDVDYFAGDKEAANKIAEFARALPPQSFLILNFDDEAMREISTAGNLKTLTFGFQEGADFRATDVKVNGGTNFKINFNGNIVPVWLEGKAGKEQIYASLLASCVGTVFGLNLIEISQALKSYH
jgi:UDP-N-acetylmuramyl pentapeptide synthase